MSKYLDTRPDDGEPPALRHAGIDCAEANDLIPALALGVIETGERYALRLHCQSCPACATILDASRRVAAFLPFAGSSHTPPDRARQALFARIADAQPAAAISSPPLTTTLTIDAPVIDSPASKRSRPDAGQMRPPVRDANTSPWALPVWSSRVSKLAVAPIALMLVLVTMYALPGLDRRSDDADNSNRSAGDVVLTDSAPAAESQGEDLGNTSSSSSDENVPFGDVTFLGLDHSESLATTEPVFQTFAANSEGAFTYRALSTSGSQTEVLRAVAPNQAACTLVATIGSRAYALTVSHVRLPGNGQLAGIYLVTIAGEQVYVGAMKIDEQGNGTATFTLNQPLDDFRSLQIGPISAEPGTFVNEPYFSAASFQLSWDDIDRGLSPAS